MFAGTAPTAGAQILREMKEFAQLPVRSQRYIRRSLEVCCGDPNLARRFARNPLEVRSVETQIALYARIEAVRAATPVDDRSASILQFIELIAPMAEFDLTQRKIDSFAAFRFLYERLAGPASRPWLLNIFTHCATLPHLDPALRFSLLKSIDRESAAASNWSPREARFLPEWVVTQHV